MATLGENVALYRRKKELTQEALGEAVGVSMQAVSKWENGGRRYHQNHQYQRNQRCAIHASYLFGQGLLRLEWFDSFQACSVGIDGNDGNDGYVGSVDTITTISTISTIDTISTNATCYHTSSFIG